MANIKPVILAYKQKEMDSEFCDFLKKYQPLGLIITQESCDNPWQLKKFIADFRDCVGREDAPVSIDQEGGRAQRLAGRILFDQNHLVLKRHPGSAHWPYYPNAAATGSIYQENGELGLKVAYQQGRALGSVLASLKIDLNFAPVIDIPESAADPIISDRAFSSNPDDVTALAREFIHGLHEFGVKSCIKHIPGHGRAKVDSHKSLPVIDAVRSELEKSDFIPLESLHEMPWAMMAHVLMRALDDKYPASQSPKIIEGLLRRDYGFSGVICTDCIWMEALKGSLPDRAVAAQRAGCDVIVAVHGTLQEQAAILEAVAPISDLSLARLAEANQKTNFSSLLGTEIKESEWRSEYEELKVLMQTGGIKLQAPPEIGT